MGEGGMRTYAKPRARTGRGVGGIWRARIWALCATKRFVQHIHSHIRCLDPGLELKRGSERERGSERGSETGSQRDSETKAQREAPIEA